MTKPPRHRRPLIEALEPRLLFSATADVAVFDDGNSDGQYLAQAADAVDLTSIYFPDEPLVDVSNIATSAVEQIIFVDVTLDGYEAIVSDIQQRYSSGEVAVVYLDPQLNGVEQITSALAQYTSLEAIHIVSHGSGGAVELGLTTLSQNTLFQYEDDLIQWGRALSGDADILLYGCDIAAHPSGQSLINQIAQLTAADVAASDDKTGHESLGGDWDLEYRVGEIETPVLVSAELQQSFVGVLATTQFINIQDGSSSQVVSSTINVGQSFSFDNGGAPYTVNQISVQLMKSAAAHGQDITIQLLDDGWSDVSPLASKTINFDKLTTEFGWKTVNFDDVTLNSNQTYIVRISSNNADGEVFVGYSDSNRWNNSEMIVSGASNASADLKLLVGYNDGVNIDSVNHVPGSQFTGQNTPLVFSAANGNQIQISDADAFPQPMEVTLTADYAHLSLGQTTGLSFTAGDGTNDYHMRFIGSIDAVNAALATITYTPATNVTGADTLRITSRDSGIDAEDAVSTVAITIYNSLNSLPADPQSVDEDSTLQFSAANSNQIQVEDTGAGVTLDPDDVQVTLSITNGSLSLANTSGVTFTTGDGSSDTTMVFSGTLIEVNAALATINFIPNANYYGSAQLTMTTESGGLIDTDSLNITVNSVNDVPVLDNPIPDQSVQEGNMFSYTIPANTFSDIDNSTLIFTAALASGSGLPPWLQFNQATRTFSGVPDDGDVGVLDIRVTVSDGNGGSISDTFNLTVINVNDDPFLNIPVPNQNATEDSAFTYTFPANTFGDGDVGASFTYTAELAAGGVLPGWLNFDSATRTFSGTPTNSDVGTLSIRLIANDGAGGIASDTFDIVIANTNDAPVVAVPISDQAATENALFNFTFGANAFSDPDTGTTLTYTATLVGGGVLPAWLSFDAPSRTFSGTPSNSDVGTLSVEVTASDGSASVADIFNIVIGNTDDSPVLLNPIPNQSATEDTPYNFQFSDATFYDPDVGDTLTYTARLSDDNVLPGWLVFDPSTRTFSGTPTNSDVGTITIKVTAADSDGGAVAVDTFDLVIANINDAPTVANPIPNQTALEDSAFNFTFAVNTFADVDVGTTLTYTAQLAGGGTLPAWLSFDAATRTFSGTPLNAHVGTVSIVVIANDGNGGTVTDTFDIVVANTNDAPTVANPIPDQSAAEDVAFNFQFTSNTFADQDVGNTLIYSAQLAGGGALPGWLSFDAATRTFSGTPANANVGSFSIDVIASDGNGGLITDTFSITVANTNDAPVVNIPLSDYYANEQTWINLHGTGISVADDDGDTLTITLSAQWSNSNLAATAGTTGVVIVSGVNTKTLVLSGTAAQLNNFFAGNNGGALTYRLSGNTPVTADVITVAASDGGLSGSDSFTVNITAVNDAPENEVPGAQVIDEGSALVFSAANGNRIQVNDLDAGAGNLEVNLSVTNGNLTLAGVAGLSFISGDGAADGAMIFRGTQADINAALAILTFNPVTDFSGSSVLTITTSDLGNTGIGGALTDTDTVAITVNNLNDAPTVANAIADQTVAEDTNLSFQFDANTFADLDSDTLTYTATISGGGALPAWLSFDAATRTFSGTPANSDVGVISIDVVANDGSGGTVTENFSITVTNTNDTPTVANAIADQTIAEDSNFNFQFAANTFADVDGDALTYTATLSGGGALPAWLSFDAATRTFSGTPANSDVGVISIDVIANDGNGGTVTENFSITVTNSNDAPTVANAIADQTIAEDANFNFQFAANTFADIDGDTLTYTATLAGGGALPAWLSFDAATRTFNGTPANADVGVISINVIADDGNGGAVTENFSITVTNTNDAPTVSNAIADQTTAEDANFNYQFAANTFADVDGDALTYTATLAGGGALPAWLSFDATTRTFSGTPANS
ncbi:putative Ig domain-containing protein, partial [Cellvibrio sp. NN19]|uniref:putative Ig domain-containing protein n=1 Tax=Cellvibrio chitinivorans TaxID=3102792 RepID=UPI002B40F1D2